MEGLACQWFTSMEKLINTLSNKKQEVVRKHSTQRVCYTTKQCLNVLYLSYLKACTQT